jgi:hypothetical protein
MAHIRKIINNQDLQRYNKIIRQQRNALACVAHTGICYNTLIKILKSGVSRNDMIDKIERFCTLVESK